MLVKRITWGGSALFARECNVANDIVESYSRMHIFNNADDDADNIEHFVFAFKLGNYSINKKNSLK